jgi:hypothetical protein
MAITMAPVKWRKDPPPFLIHKPTKTAENFRREKSILLTADMAERAALALQSLSSILPGSVEVLRDHHTTAETHGEERFYVRYCRKTNTPATEATVYVENTDAPLRPDQIKAQITRAERASRQYAEMAFFPCEDGEGAFWCLHFKEEETSVYVVHPDDFGCTCPDWFYRKNLHDGKCKHVLAYLIHAGLPLRKRLSRFPDTPEGRQALDAHIRESLSRDF